MWEIDHIPKLYGNCHLINSFVDYFSVACNETLKKQRLKIMNDVYFGFCRALRLADAIKSLVQCLFQTGMPSISCKSACHTANSIGSHNWLTGGVDKSSVKRYLKIISFVIIKDKFFSVGFFHKV